MPILKTQWVKNRFFFFFLMCGFLIPAKRNSCCARLQETVGFAHPVLLKIYKFKGSLGFLLWCGHSRENGVGYAGAPAMLGMLSKGSRACGPQGFWFLSQPVLFWPGAPIHPSIPQPSQALQGSSRVRCFKDTRKKKQV